MKKLLLVLMVIVMASFLFTGCALLDWIGITPEPEPEPIDSLAAVVEVVDWEQDNDFVTVYYTITNTGEVSVDNYQIEFIALCTDGSIFGDWTEMFENGIDVGDYVFAEFEIDVDTCTVISVDVGEWELIHWDF